uniref:peptide MFS transporter n=1 Tax=Ornithobacterium rhinotracheale TaxID=28251 RepID=UPI0039A753E1
MNAKTKKGHPMGLYLLFFTEMWERFSYYGMRGILILYLTKQFVEGGLAIDPKIASLIFGWFTGFVYFTPLIGGWLADNFLGQRKAITIGGITMMAGQLVLFSINTHMGMYLGLFLLIIGNGFFKPNISTLVGGLYPDGDKRRDSAFSIFYMGINLGAFLAPLVIGVLTEDIFAVKNAAGEFISHGYRYGFLASAVGMLLGQIMFNTFAQKYLGDLGKFPSSKKQTSAGEDKTAETSLPLTKEERQRVTVIFVYFFFAIFFFAGFEQAGSSLTLYTDKFINRMVDLPFIGNYEIPTAWFQSVNPVFIVMFAPLFAIFWGTKFGQKLTTPLKMGLGMVILGIGFWFMLGSVYERSGNIFVNSEDIAIKASIWWLILTYMVHTIGELCLSPVGLSVVTKLSPPKLASLLMGVWLMSSFFANVVGGYLASSVESLGAGQIFFYISAFVIICGLAMIALNRKLVEMMHGVK